MTGKVLSADELNHLSTEELKNKLLELIKDRDSDPLNKKILFYKTELSPIFNELSGRNKFPNAEDQVSLVLGAWASMWSTIPFQEILPGRVREQSYQIFHDDGYYANIARYAPGHKLSFLKIFSSIMLAYDLMILQRYEVKNGHWCIQNVGIEQDFKIRGIPLSIDKAEDWFTKAVKSKSKLALQNLDSLQLPKLDLDETTNKKFEKTFLATPQLEHLYIDREFRLVKTQREAKQRPSYTIAVRIQ